MWHRKPVVAGSFYPSDKDELKTLIIEYLNKVEDTNIRGDIITLISPHAGYIYSGSVAAYSYNQLRKISPELVIVLAPSHRGRFNGASVIEEGTYETPLGEVDIDTRICEKLIDEPYFGFIKEAHEGEHSLEVQIPFIQAVLKDFLLVPVIIGTTEFNTCRMIGERIGEILKDEKRKFCIVVSTDLSHYHSYNEAVEMDSKLIESLKTLDIDSINKTCSSGNTEACGEGPVIAAIAAAKILGANTFHSLKYLNSGDTAGSKDQVVGYLSAAISRE